MLVAILVLLVVLIFLAAAEMGLSKMTKPKAAAMADQGLKSGKALSRLVEDPARWVNPILLTVNVCQTVQATLTGVVAGRLFGAAGVVIGIGVNVVVFYVLAEAVPKTYAVIYPEKAALLAARPVWTLANFWPLQFVSRGLISLTNVIVKGKGLQQGPFVSEQELLGIVEAAAQDEVIEHEERELIESIIEFGDTVAREVMVPFPDVVTIADTFSVREAVDVAIEHGFSRLPVLSPDDDVRGVTFIKDLVRAERSGQGAQLVTMYMRDAVVIPENKPVAQLMRDMQARKYHMAVVADEYGSIEGIVTLEDCLEELVGEIVDEYDKDHKSIVKHEDGQYLVDGTTSVSEVNEELDTDIPDDEWESIGGFVFNTLGHVPAVGEHIDFDGWRFTVAELQGRRIRSIRVQVVARSGDDEADD